MGKQYQFHGVTSSRLDALLTLLKTRHGLNLEPVAILADGIQQHTLKNFSIHLRLQIVEGDLLIDLFKRPVGVSEASIGADLTEALEKIGWTEPVPV